LRQNCPGEVVNLKTTSAPVRVAAGYLTAVRLVSPNTWLYLSFVLLSGIGLAVFLFLLNFYATALGYSREFLGQLNGWPYMTGAIAAIPMGLLCDRVGRRRSIIIGIGGCALSIGAVSLLTARLPLLVGTAGYGVAYSLLMVAAGPFLYENTTAAERIYAFSLFNAFELMAQMAGNAMGGLLPGLGVWGRCSPMPNLTRW